MKLLILLPLLLLAACDNRPLDQREYRVERLENIPELKGCTYINVDHIKVIRCPNSTTSTQWTTSNGKQSRTHHTIVVE